MNLARHAGKSPKGQFKCNICQKACPMKNGDWFISGQSSGQQVFICKECEQKAKGTHKRVMGAQNQ